MGSMPDMPDPQTRTAITERIIAHVTRGWPRLGEPVVCHRGQYCYVAALLPGQREPTPILRLRYQGSADRCAIGIYLASTGQYTESELPASLGPKTGTPDTWALALFSSRNVAARAWPARAGDGWRVSLPGGSGPGLRCSVLARTRRVPTGSGAPAPR